MTSNKWEITTAEEFCFKVTDGTHDSPKRANYGKRLITSKHLDEVRLDFDNAYLISEDDYEKINLRSKVDQYDILFSMIGTVGTIYLEKSKEIQYAVKNVGIFKSKSQLDAKWLYYYLKSSNAKKYLHANLNGSTQQYITLGALRKLPILNPDSQLKEFVVDILSSLDDKIEINNKINNNLEELAQTLYKRWFVDFEFPNEEGKPYKSSGGDMVESELGLIPKGWEIKRLGNYFPVLTGKKNANIATETGQYKFFTCSREIYHTDDYSFDAEAILVAGNGDFNVKYYKGKFEAYQRTYVLIPYNPSLTGLLYYAVKKNLSLITAGSRGSVISFITKGNIEDYQIVMPEDDKLYDLSKIFYDYLSLTAINNSESEKLSATRDLLLPKLMSGEIEV